MFCKLSLHELAENNLPTRIFQGHAFSAFSGSRGIGKASLGEAMRLAIFVVAHLFVPKTLLGSLPLTALPADMYCLFIERQEFWPFLGPGVSQAPASVIFYPPWLFSAGFCCCMYAFLATGPSPAMHPCLCVRACVTAIWEQNSVI